MSEGQGGGEFYTPSSIVRLLTEVIEPYHGASSTPRAVRAACSSPRRASSPSTSGKLPLANLPGEIVRRTIPVTQLASCPSTASRKPTKRPPLPPEPRVHASKAKSNTAATSTATTTTARRHGPLRLRPGQPAVQRQRRGQGTVEGHGRPGRRFPSAAAHR